MHKEEQKILKRIPKVYSIISLMDGSKKTGNKIATDWDLRKPSKYTKTHLPELFKSGLAFEEKVEKGTKSKPKGTYYTLNYNRFWDFFYEHNKGKIEKPNQKQKDELTAYFKKSVVIKIIKDMYVGSRLKKDDAKDFLSVLLLILYQIWQSQYVKKEVEKLYKIGGISFTNPRKMKKYAKSLSEKIFNTPNYEGIDSLNEKLCNNALNDLLVIKFQQHSQAF